MTKQEQLIEKQRELLQRVMPYVNGWRNDDALKVKDMYDELLILESEIKEKDEPKIEEVKVYNCPHPDEYVFLDKDGNFRCSDCHRVIE